MDASPLKLVLRSIFCVAGLLAAGCYPKAGPAPGALSNNSVTWAQAKWPGETAESLGVGREAYLAKCNGCHDYPDLAVIQDEKWPAIVDRMAGKSDLDEKKEEAVLHYILAAKHP